MLDVNPSCRLAQVTAAMRPECVPEYAALNGGGCLMGGSPSPSIGELSGDGDSNGATVGDRRHHHVHSPSCRDLGVNHAAHAVLLRDSCTLAQQVPRDVPVTCLTPSQSHV